MARRAVVFAKGTGFAKGPMGDLIQVVKETTKVVDVDCTMGELMKYADEKDTNSVQIVFETEDPDIREPKLVK